MKYAFVVFDVDDSSKFGWEFVGVFATEAHADKACISERHMMACVTIGKATNEKAVEEWEFGFKFPRYEEEHGAYERGANNYRLPDDLLS